jgi:hypothetical protein
MRASLRTRILSLHPSERLAEAPKFVVCSSTTLPVEPSERPEPCKTKCADFFPDLTLKTRTRGERQKEKQAHRNCCKSPDFPCVIHMLSTGPNGLVASIHRAITTGRAKQEGSARLLRFFYSIAHPRPASYSDVAFPKGTSTLAPQKTELEP